MNVHVHEENFTLSGSSRQEGAELIGAANGATNGFCLGIELYYAEEFGEPGIHDDQEGFYILEGTGKAKIGDQVFDIRPGSALIAPRGVPHCIIKDPGSGPLKAVWCHGLG